MIANQTLRLAAWLFLLAIPASPVFAHASEQGFVLLLPTDIYVVSGAASVGQTVLLLTVLPDQFVASFFRPIAALRIRRTGLPVVSSCLSALLLAALIWAGFNGSHDPLANPLPVFFWTVWWIGFITLQGLLGDLWRWLNPWTGPVFVLRRTLNIRPFLRFPTWMGHSVALLTFMSFAAFLLADPAPADPERLAWVVSAYWLFTLLAFLAFGPRWLRRAEGLSVVLRVYARMGVFGRKGNRFAVGIPGWQALNLRTPAIGIAVLMLLMLGSGSFDGLNETFWWLGLIGVNPLEFPGRSAVITQNLTGLALANIWLISAYAMAIWLGLALIKSTVPLSRGFCLFAPSILPIALGYHIAHYFPSFLVDSQYVLSVATDPMGAGADFLQLGTYYVTTGFFNSQDSVRLIWLTQAAAVVGGHILAVMLAHAIALRHFGTTRHAVLSQVPLALFMVLYTLFGLWLLASPRG
ncbi:MAG: hypothetical protein KUG62_06680 [Rhodobacteraceae bacterium]|nr:hypothetical protein [Paracoccaceae bacterium]